MVFHLCVYHHISLNLSVTLKQASIVYSVAILPAFIALNDCSEERVPCTKCSLFLWLTRKCGIEALSVKVFGFRCLNFSADL